MPEAKQQRESRSGSWLDISKVEEYAKPFLSEYSFYDKFAWKNAENISVDSTTWTRMLLSFFSSSGRPGGGWN